MDLCRIQSMQSLEMHKDFLKEDSPKQGNTTKRSGQNRKKLPKTTFEMHKKMSQKMNAELNTHPIVEEKSEMFNANSFNMSYDKYNYQGE